MWVTNKNTLLSFENVSSKLLRLYKTGSTSRFSSKIKDYKIKL